MSDAVAAAAPAAPSAAPASPSPAAAPASAPAPGAAPSPASPGALAPKAPETTPEPRRFKLNVKGAEREYDEAEFTRLAQKGAAAGEAFRAAAEERKRVEGLTSRLKSGDARAKAEALAELVGGPEAVSQLGVELVKLQMIQAGVDPETGQPLDPREQKMRELEQKLAAKEAQEKEAQEKAAQETEQAQARGLHERWNKELGPAIQAKGLPVTAVTVGFVAQHILETAQAAKAAGVDLDPRAIQAEAVEQAAEDVQRITTGILDAMPAAEIKQRHPALFEKVRKHIVAEWKARQGGAAARPAPSVVQPREPEQKAPPSMDEWRERMMREG